jgi:hypothetical protein
VINGDPRHSDHRPVIICLEGRRREGGGRGARGGFRFEASWLEEEKCQEVVEEAWKMAVDGNAASVHDAIKAVASGLGHRSKNVLGDLEKRVKFLKKELERCQRSGISKEQVVREKVLRFKLERVEEQIDTYWKQRAHVKWLEKGDRNTSFFHAACTERRRQNRIGKLRRDDGGWVEREEEKKSFITNYFVQLFRSQGSHELNGSSAK